MFREGQDPPLQYKLEALKAEVSVPVRPVVLDLLEESKK